VTATEAERPAVAIAMQRGAEADRLGWPIASDATNSLRNFQANFAPPVASLGFGEIRQ